MKRAEYRQVALLRLRDAQALLRMRRYAAAYYLAGYVIECALKACIARRFRQADIPNPAEVREIYTHRLERLLALANLQVARDQQARQDPQFDVYWGNVRRWTEDSRYEPQRSRTEAEDLVRAIADPTHGVLRWLQQYW